MDLILASGSPRRKELLSLYTTDFTICVSDFDESTVTADTPARLVEKLARGKCLAVAKDHPGAVVLGCDTVVDVGGEVFGKPRSTEDAKRMLRACPVPPTRCTPVSACRTACAPRALWTAAKLSLIHISEPTRP